MRPSAIVNFERLFILSSAIGLAMLFLTDGAADLGVDPTLVLGAGVVAVAITVALAFWASRGRSNLARWLLAVATAYGLVTSGYGIAQALAADETFGLGDFPGLVPVLLQAAAVGLLFTAGARAWFAREDVIAS